MLKKSNIVGKLGRARRYSGENVQNSGVHLSGICLSGYRITGFKSHLLGNHGVRLHAFLMISVKKLKERCLRTGRTL